MVRVLSFAITALLASAVFAQQPVMPQMPDMNAMFFQQFDANKDGQVSLAEFRAPSDQQFAQMDANRDGVVAREEVEAFTQRMMQFMQQQMQQQAPTGR